MTRELTPWPSDFELEMRAALTEIRAHQLRQDKLLMDLQLEMRAGFKLVAAQLQSVAALLSNGASSHGP